MDNKKILDVMEDLYFHYTNNSIEQSELIPRFTSDDIHLVKEFEINHESYKVGYVDQETGIEDKRIAIKTDKIIFKPILRSAISNYDTRGVIEGETVLELFNSNTITPFILFINGRFVKWSEISIYKDNRYCFLVIDTTIDYSSGNTLSDTDIEILQLPLSGLSYTEKTKIDKDNTLIFAFDTDGYLNISGSTLIYMNTTNIEYKQLLLPGGNILNDDIQIPDECLLYPSNIITFKDNILYSNATVTVSPYNTLTIDDGNTIGLEYKMFYDKTSNLPYNNVSQIINHDYLKDRYLYPKENQDWLSILHQEFDFNFDNTKSYDENIEAFSTYMKGYNYRDLVDRIKSDNVYSIKGSIGELYNKQNILLMFPVEYKSPGYMLFINGILSNNIINQEYTYGVRVDLSAFTDNSIYEFIIFNDTIKEYLRSSISEDPEEKYFSGYHTFENDFDLYCGKHPDAIFELNGYLKDVNSTFRLQYKVNDSDYSINEDGTIKLGERYMQFKDADIFKVPRNKFVHEEFIITQKEDFNVHLTKPEFAFCDDMTKYMVFLNGYRVHSSLYRVIVPSTLTPFLDQAIYFSIILKEGDVIDVFYTPMSIIDEVYIEDLNHSTVSGTGVDQLGYITGPSDYKVPISRNLQFFFVNGIKIPYDYLMDISYDKARIIVNMKTIESLCLIGFDNDLIDLFESLNLDKSKLDLVYDAHDKMGINILTETYTAVTNVKPHRSKEIADHALINEIIRFYYARVNTGKPFRYEYDKSVYADVDAAGNIVIDTMDANKNVNLELEK